MKWLLAVERQSGRLAQLKTGYNTVSDSLQDMRYTYDLAGNVLTISDYKAGGIQTQTFEYDDLDRLVSAVAGGTGGTYALQSYSYDTNGRLEINAGVTYSYNNPAHVHAVTSTTNGNSYGYDANGNQTTRTMGGITYTLIYDAENRLVQIKRGNDIQATYYYDGDSNRVKTVVGSTTTTYVGNYLEWTGSTTSMKKYYYSNGQRVAMRQGSSTLYFLLTDHLGSTAVTATSGGGWYSELRYYPWGGTRYTSGTTPTSYRYTGQREAEVGLYYYGARYFDPALGRFVQADSIIPNPGNPIAWDRYAYTANNPVKYVDPSGHGYCSNLEYVPDNECAELDLNGDGMVGAPWQEDDGYEPESNNIPDWDDNSHLVDAERKQHAEEVWEWLCIAGGWWGSGCPDAAPLAAWLLWQEGGSLYNEFTDPRMRDRAATIIVGLFFYLFTDPDGITASDLSRFTAFFDPELQDDGFTSIDWRELQTLSLPSLFTGVVDDLWGDGPYKHNGHVVDRWWDNREAVQCTNCIVVLEVYIPIEDKTLYFGYRE